MCQSGEETGAVGSYAEVFLSRKPEVTEGARVTEGEESLVTGSCWAEWSTAKGSRSWENKEVVGPGIRSSHKRFEAQNATSPLWWHSRMTAFPFVATASLDHTRRWSHIRHTEVW